jgi:hypothetical protein
MREMSFVRCETALLSACAPSCVNLMIYEARCFGGHDGYENDNDIVGYLFDAHIIFRRFEQLLTATGHARVLAVLLSMCLLELRDRSFNREMDVQPKPLIRLQARNPAAGHVRLARTQDW